MSELIEKNDAPDFLAPVEGQKAVGGERLSEYRRPSYAKVIQRQTGEPYVPPFHPGDLIALPDNQLILAAGEIAHVVPIFFFQEFTLRAPYGEKEFIVERTFDATTELARKCRSRDMNLRKIEKDGKDFDAAEVLNFVCIFLDHNDNLGMKPVVLSFSMGEWKYGSNFASLIDARLTNVNHICGNRFQISIGTHRNQQYSWMGVDVTNPEDGKKYVEDAKLFNTFCKMHDELASLYEANDIEVDYDNAASEVSSSEFE